MARISVTDYECEHDLLPAVCAKCAAPASDRVTRTLYFLHGHVAFFKVLGSVFGLFFFPPLFLLITSRYAQTMQVRVPMCPDHRNDWKWRERALNTFVFPLWSATVIAFEVIGVVVQAQGYDASAYFCVGPPALTLALLAENVLILPGSVRLMKPEKGVRMTGVHDEFVAALQEDRARDRVANPDRRALRGDMRDDFDDEPV
jgi:hypothetical protein